MTTALQTAIAKIADATTAIDALVAASATASTTAEQPDDLVQHIEDLRSLSKAVRDLSYRTTTVVHAVDARISNLRDVKRAA